MGIYTPVYVYIQAGSSETPFYNLPQLLVHTLIVQLLHSWGISLIGQEYRLQL